jgi:hypothetical protein
MGVGVMRHKKLKLEDLKASHTLGKSKFLSLFIKDCNSKDERERHMCTPSDIKVAIVCKAHFSAHTLLA